MNIIALMRVKNYLAVAISIVIVLFIAFSIFWAQLKPVTVIIQAGHEGRTEGNTGSFANGNSEVKWNILVANEVAKELKIWNIQVKRVPADTKLLKAKIAVAIHFDGAKHPCHSGASVGYPNSNSKAFAQRWKRLYKAYYPFKWHKDNFTKNLSNYYGFYYIRADKFLVLELGEISCKKQTKWLKPRLKKIAHLVAYAIAKELGYSPNKPAF